MAFITIMLNDDTKRQTIHIRPVDNIRARVNKPGFSNQMFGVVCLKLNNFEVV